MKLDVLVYFYRQFNVQCHVAINAMIAGLVRAGVDVNAPPMIGSSVVHWARNDSLKMIRGDADWVLFVDDDMLPEADSGLKLLDVATDGGISPFPVRHIVSALTVTRKIPPALNVKRYLRDEDRFVFIESVKPNTLLSGDFGVGAGFLLCSHRFIKQAKEYWLTARDWADDYRPLFLRIGADPEKVEVERRRLESERRARFKATGGTTRIFNFLDAPQAEQNGEDITFCRTAIRLGYPVSVHTGIMVGHVGDFPYGPWNLEDGRPEDLRFPCDTG